MAAEDGAKAPRARGQWAEGASPHMAALSAPPAIAPRSPKAQAAPSPPGSRDRRRLPHCGRRLPSGTLARGEPIPSPAPFLCQALAVQRPASGALSPHLHGDAPALHGGEAVGQREARSANPVPGALHRVGLGEVGTHGGGWQAACGAGKRDATLAGAGAGAPGALVAGSKPGCAADARCRRKARGGPGGGNGTGAGRERKRKRAAPDPALLAR